MSIFNVFTLIVYFINFAISITIIFKNREKPEKTIGWLLIFMLLPFVGLILYFFIGRNWNSHNLREDISSELSEFIDLSVKEYKGENKDLVTLVSKGNNSPLFLYNDLKIYKDGKEKFKDLLIDIKNAKHHIHLEYYIIKSDNIGREIFELLKVKVKEGVEVRVIMDKVGCRKFDKIYLEELKNSGIFIIIYMAQLASISRFIDTSINYRNHRKMVIIDGNIGYIGGNNIGDEYLGQGELGYWRDSHLRVKGDFVLGMQALFFEDYFSVHDINLEHSKRKYSVQEDIYNLESNLQAYFPITKTENYAPMQIVYNGPASEHSTIEQLFLKLITSAKKTIHISSPYFIPSASLSNALIIAIQSGIEVKILFPEQYDHPPVGHASMTYIKELLDVGAKFYYYDKNAFSHNKAIVIDSKMFTLGTANFDVRSFFYNYEVNAIIYDRKTSQEMIDLFDEDLLVSRKLTLTEYNEGSKFTHFKESFFRIFSPLF
ncbi:MAG: cardiolipin synthase [Clostridium sp.]|nr:cardiolipin synthase [Clostridium sp.]